MSEANCQIETLALSPVGIIALPGCEAMAEKLNRYLLNWETELMDEERMHCKYYTRQGSFLVNTDFVRFSTGEGKVVISSSVRGLDLYILIDITAANQRYSMFGVEHRRSPDDLFADLKRVISAASGRADRITVVMPMLYEGRQHNRTCRESMDCAIMLQELAHLGVDCVVTFDAHDPRVHNAIPMVGFENIMPTYQVLQTVMQTIPDLEADPQKLIVVSPDEGAMKRNMYYRAALGVGMGTFYKQRDYAHVVNGSNPIIAHQYLGESVEGKDVFVSDDMISSGGSMLDLARQLKARNARRIIAAVSFGLFSSGLEAFDKAYDEGIIDRVFATNLTSLSPELLSRPWFTQVDMSKTIAMVIAALNHNESVQMSTNLWKHTRALVTEHKTK